MKRRLKCKGRKITYLAVNKACRMPESLKNVFDTGRST